MSEVTLRLVIVSQDRQLLDTPVDAVTAPSQTGEVTILPQHVPLFTPLVTGELRFTVGKEEHSFVVSKGFLDVGPDNSVTIMVDNAVAARDISVQKAEEAMQQAQAVIMTSRDRQELIRAEAELRRALLEIKVAQRTSKTRI